jgi:hypothetical protein
VKSADPYARDRHALRARWRAETVRRTSAELRRATERGGQDELVGRVAVDWRRLSDGPTDLLAKLPAIGLLAGPVRWGFDQASRFDPYTEISKMELEVSGLVTGKLLRLRAAPAESTALHWEFSGRQADWWARLEVQKDAVALPGDFTGS